MFPNAQSQLMGSRFITYLVDLLTDLAMSVHNFSTTSFFEYYVELWFCKCLHAFLNTHVLSATLHRYLEGTEHTQLKG